MCYQENFPNTCNGGGHLLCEVIDTTAIDRLGRLQKVTCIRVQALSNVYVAILLTDNKL